MSTFIPSDTNCGVMNCNKTALSEPVPYQDVHVFYLDKGSEDGTLYFKKCPKCKAIYYYNFTLLSNGERISSLKTDNDVVLWFANVGYHKRLMRQLDSDILHKHSGFSNFANADNYFCEKTNIINRKPMDRIHLEKTWLFWRLTHYFDRENINLATPASFEFHYTLMNLREVCRTVFVRRWSSKSHSRYCTKDCSQLLVLDGHQKATRRVCSVKELTTPSRELGTVKVGCHRTPKRGEKNCHEHIFFQEPLTIPLVKKKRKTYNSRRKKKPIRATRFLTCRTLKSKNQQRFLHRTSGIIAAVYNCGYICALQELYGAESISQVYMFLVQIVNEFENTPTVLAYDDACHLVSFIKNAKNFERRTAARKRIDNMTIVCDKMHYKNHVDPRCRRNCSPYNHEIAKRVNTEKTENNEVKLKLVVKEPAKPDVTGNKSGSNQENPRNKSKSEKTWCLCLFETKR
ncbi:unnamed protein product [Didymodactylos carnosus]|uniref:CxC5 like cysteine cluster associated with KDZ domain-containing protein n=1 Tax=Didymodactylos carnosus TaxID=1234261 RepID=A0A8S2EIH2_9BILA|nr:unnamed protein product [Didymodactylos carnosus]CAF3960641.1 unnamed protein product [Didymodactylos carnosus]